MSRKVVVKNQPATHSSQTGTRLLLIGIAILTLCPSTGCRSTRAFFRDINEATMLTYRDEVWSRRAYNLRYGNCDRPYSEHFQNGFEAGYVAVSNGGDGYVPALPPEDYRTYEFQSADGAKCVNSWFEGYPEGVAAAKHDKAGTYHDVLISRMINSAIQQEENEAVLPSDIPITTVGQNSVANTTIAQNNLQASFQDKIDNYRTQAAVLARPRQNVPPRAKATQTAPSTSLNRTDTQQVVTPKPAVTKRYTPPPQATTLPPITTPSAMPQAQGMPPILKPNPESAAQTDPAMQTDYQAPAMKQYSIMKTYESLPIAQAPGDGNSTNRIR